MDAPKIDLYQYFISKNELRDIMIIEKTINVYNIIL